MSTNVQSSPPRAGHSHGWLVGVLGLLAGLTLATGFPRLPTVGASLVLVVAFHVFGALVGAGSLVAVAPRLAARLLSPRRALAPDSAGVDFGWSFTAIWGPWVVSLALAAIALGLMLELPALWPACFAVALLSVSSFVGGLLLRSSARLDHAPLPMVRLFAGEDDRVLDLGCGGGRTTLALAKALPKGRFVSLDRFDADYIDGGGRALFERNLRIAGISDRVEVRPGDMTAVPFPDAHFDTVVSAHALDHLGERAPAALAEVRRVLRPDGRFLFVAWVPGWLTFTLANVLCVLLPSPADWRRMAGEAGLRVADEGWFNGLWFAVFERDR